MTSSPPSSNASASDTIVPELFATQFSFWFAGIAFAGVAFAIALCTRDHPATRVPESTSPEAASSV